MKGLLVQALLFSVLAFFTSAIEESSKRDNVNVENYPKSFDEAKDIIQSHVKSFKSSSPLCSTGACCNITSIEGCSIRQMAADISTLVFPGGSTRCISSQSTPFAFQVIPGASDKLLVYFQGGGACWNEATTRLGFCTFDISLQALVGVFDRFNPNNQFREHTVVYITYCSGDVFAGNSTRPYNDPLGVPYQQVGLLNAQSALDWIKAQVKSGGLASSFSELVVMGASAGSVGAQLWSNQILKQFSWKTAAVIPDSYAGVFPEGSMGPLMYDFGFCQSGFLSPELYTKCMNQQLQMVDIGLEYGNAMPNVPYAFIQSKTDIVQIAFFIAIAATTRTSPVIITPTEFYQGVNEIFGAYNSKLPNFVTYLVDGTRHCFSNYALFYTADTISCDDADIYYHANDV